MGVRFSFEFRHALVPTLAQAWPMGHRVRKYPASPYPRPSARAVTEASRVRVSG